MKKLKVVGIVFVVIVLILGVGSVYLLRLNLYSDHRGLDLEGSYEYMYKTYPTLQLWVDSMNACGAIKDTFVVMQREGEDFRVHALYAYAQNSTNKTAVIVHGYTDNAIRELMLGQMYSQKLGYNILIPDLMHCGKSEGEYIGMGFYDRLDVLQWMEIANQIFGGNTQMVVHGISMGGATVMMVSGEEQKTYVKCFVEDCGYTSVWDIFSKEIQCEYGLPVSPFLDMINWVCIALDDWDFKSASAEKAVAKSSLPMLFIHGGKDDFVPTNYVKILYAAKTKGYKEMWIAPGAIHARSYLKYPEIYTEKVRQFTQRFISE